jgi:hypothetical protein
MNPTPKYQEGLHYSEDIRNAVLFGYLYRKEAEKQREVLVHCSLGDVPEVLQWLTSLIVSGLAWDILKTIAKKLYRGLIKEGTPLDEVTKSILSDEEELEKFYRDVCEFNKQCMSVTEKQFKYIKEEIMADVYGEEAQKIFDREKRLPNHQEYLEMYRKALNKAEELLGKYNYVKPH